MDLWQVCVFVRPGQAVNNTRKDAGEREVSAARGQPNKVEFGSRERAEKAQKKRKTTSGGGERRGSGCW